MIEATDPGDVAAALVRQLAEGEATALAVEPILRHLLASDEPALFGEEIVARVRGMTADVALRLLDAGGSAPRSHPPEEVARVTSALLAAPGFLAHVHALAHEWRVTAQLHAGLAVDPVLPPLVQALMASPDPETAALAMNLLAAQARFAQAQRRMRLPLAELPGDVLHQVLAAAYGDPADPRAAAVRRSFDEGRTRLGLLSRLALGMGPGVIAALAVEHAGPALFLTALAQASGEPRDRLVLALGAEQGARLALLLRAAGLKPANVVAQFAALHPGVPAPGWLDAIGPDRAAAILAVAVRR